MISIDSLRVQLKEFYSIEERITFDLPQYELFLSELRLFIYENHFENTPEWEKISDNLVYMSSQYMSRQEADTIMLQLEKLHRRLLAKCNEGFWSYVHPLIMNVSQQKIIDGHYADAVESACKEINSRLKSLLRKHCGEEKDGSKLMKRVFSLDNPFLIFEGLDTDSGRNVQIGYIEIFSGVMTGIRNPKAHENQLITREAAIKRLILTSLLMDKVDEAIKYTGIIE